MLAFKGFTKDLTSRCGSGERLTFKVGETYEEPEAKTVRNGFHCCEYIFDCLNFYKFDGVDRFCVIDVEDFDEEGYKIAAKKMTILKELTPAEFAKAGYEYIIKHPRREGWECHHGSVNVGEVAEIHEAGHIGISRSKTPMVKSCKGGIVGLIWEKEPNVLVPFPMFKAKAAGTFRIDSSGRMLVE